MMNRLNEIQSAIRDRSKMEESFEYKMQVITQKRLDLERKVEELRKLMEPTQQPPFFEGFTIKEKTTK